ncbi:MAG: class I SAM-dependent methyltransferase, partial [bacterium]|nr:class I SAM-dependent methyltransferase [bacterium]
SAGVSSRLFKSSFAIIFKLFMDKDYANFLLRKTKEDYNLIAEDFSSTRQLIWPETRDLIDKYLAEGEKVLDLGCGNGRYFEYFKEKKVNYWGVDGSEKLIELAKKRYPGANFQIANALSLPFPDNFFDKIFCIAVLHHIPSEELRERFFQEAKRVLKPGGILIITVWNFRELKEFFLVSKAFISRVLGLSKLDFRDFWEPWGNKAKRYYHYFSQKELISLSQKANLKTKEIGIVKNAKGTRRNTYLVAEK